MKTATLIKNLGTSASGAKQSLYLVQPPMVGEGFTDDEEKPLWTYVVVSSVDAFGTGDETYIFPANEKGEIVSWLELDGSMCGTLSHTEALANAGYTVTHIGIE